MYLSIASPTSPPGAHGVSGEGLSNQICTILHIWGIAFFANPLQYPMFSLGTHHPGDLLLLIVKTLYVAVYYFINFSHVHARGHTKGNPVLGAPPIKYIHT